MSSLNTVKIVRIIIRLLIALNRLHSFFSWNPFGKLRIFNRTFSPAFFSHLKTALFNRAGVGGVSE